MEGRCSMMGIRPVLSGCDCLDIINSVQNIVICMIIGRILR